MSEDTSLRLPSGGSMRVAVALPEGPGPHPGVVVIHEAFGLDRDIRSICDRFAGEGYAAIAPDLFSTGWTPRCMVRIFRDMGREGPTPTRALLEVARDDLAAMPQVDGDRIAVIGFCMGGGFALAMAIGGGMRASSVNYGQVPAGAERLRGACPVVGSYGGRDGSLRGAATRLRENLTSLGIANDVKEYPEAGHGFINQADHWMARFMVRFGAGYREEEAEDSWSRILAFFAEHVRGTAG